MAKNKPKIEQYHLHKDQPEKLQFEIYSLSDYLTKNKGHTEKPHIHSFYQIIWFTKGNGMHFVDFNEFKASTNKIFFISKNQIHYFDNFSSYEGVIIHFNESFLMDNESDIDIFLKYNIFNDFESEPVFTIPSVAIENFSLLVSNLKNEIENPNNFAHKDFLKHFLKLFLISIQRLGKRNNCKNPSINNQQNITLLKFKKSLELNFNSIHSVKEYANILNISSKTLTNHTRETALKTPLELINDRIILEAKRLLSHSNFNINEIGFQLGFEDPSYFVKFFKKQTKKSPSDFRKAIS
ncbi:AraC family transcriptional regulator [Flavobacterium muglaense]|uniref:Helix-turn-helix domain-containing protein n=1 Tax=Flavobacterium muglaense TaxID=2764716 RepID=A0A923SGZ9_9FLAO|nr:AraC family transcriptional regulator [Flavobacterium muglaense]MBC5839768.1 helix-turn-helix domain-containing protein [Flavobacterium muglaense]MBC5846297.1 helix-turn-helix domain-containing protein [Flavobacterium muglaense]